MKKIAVCFTKPGAGILEKINEGCVKNGIEAPDCYVCMDSDDFPKSFKKTGKKIGEWTREVFQTSNALIFIGATGIAVRAISGLPKDKLGDCPVIVIDDNGQFVIPLLSGHAGGANKLAVILSELLGAIPVITTSTDVNDSFSVDTFAVENRLTIANRDGIKRVSVKAIENKKVTLSIKNYPPKEKVDVAVSDDTDAECSLLLKPKKYTVGLGMKKDKDKKAVLDFFLKTLENIGIETSEVYAICTIDLKEDEEAITDLRDRFRIPVLSFDKEILNKVQGNFEASDFVKNTVGVDNVCERAAVAGAGPMAELVLKKQAHNGMTIAIARRNSPGIGF
ncbi:cobalt-precorrin 5A hydrolase [Butyrivibrio sp. WCE2006]|uniref:cobalt-precorrin 5A hydrolase n=1 Tax=Butyrivibrio sp. WCE2006 TaxID=1410611 RepID=UPI000679BC3A|nr:cobalamin biosynthesis protein [Butyrivibrio sp. WCE2006]